MTPDQEKLLRDKLAVWRDAADHGLLDFRDYNRRAVDALEALFDDAEAAESTLSSQSAALGRLVEACEPFAELFAAAEAFQKSHGWTEAYSMGFAYGDAEVISEDFRALAQALGDVRGSTKGEPK